MGNGYSPRVAPKRRKASPDSASAARSVLAAANVDPSGDPEMDKVLVGEAARRIGAEGVQARVSPVGEAVGEVIEKGVATAKRLGGRLIHLMRLDLPRGK